MKINALVFASLVVGFGLAGSVQAKGKEHWVCMKDSAEVPVKGKTPAEKKSDCLAQSGAWEKAGHAGGKHAEGGAAKEQSSGSGGAW